MTTKRVFFTTALVLAVLSALLAAACGSAKHRALSVRWESQQAGPVSLDPRDESGSLHQTVVYIQNGGSRLRDARLRLRNGANTALGLDVGGTVTNTSTLIEGGDQVWRLGDLEADGRVTFPLGLWFDLSPQLEKADGVHLTLELLSPDLAAPVESTALVVKVASKPS
jgi:hypothetical protein